MTFLNPYISWSYETEKVYISQVYNIFQLIMDLKMYIHLTCMSSKSRIPKTNISPKYLMFLELVHPPIPGHSLDSFVRSYFHFFAKCLSQSFVFQFCKGQSRMIDRFVNHVNQTFESEGVFSRINLILWKPVHFRFYFHDAPLCFEFTFIKTSTYM